MQAGDSAPVAINMSEESDVSLPARTLDQIRSVAQGLEYQEVVPAKFKGKSGIKHKFSALFRGKGRYFAVDVYDEVLETDILRGRIKEQDVDIPYCIETADTPPRKALKLAKYYGITIVTSTDLNQLKDVMKGEGSSSRTRVRAHL
jgi:hypothetical protein